MLLLLSNRLVIGSVVIFWVSLRVMERVVGISNKIKQKLQCSVLINSLKEVKQLV